MDNIKNIINSCIEEVSCTIRDIILFGSRAKNTYIESSDYDILIIINENISNDEKIKLSCIITKRLADIWIDADIIVKSMEEIKLYQNCIGSVVRNALMEGVKI